MCRTGHKHMHCIAISKHRETDKTSNSYITDNKMYVQTLLTEVKCKVITIQTQALCHER